MFGKIICPDLAYEQLKKSGVVDLILNETAKKSVKNTLLNRCIDDNIINNASGILKINRFNSKDEKIIMYEDLVNCNTDYNTDEFAGFSDFNSLLTRHPAYLGYLVLGEDILKYKDFGFNNGTSLEKAVTAFCIGEKHEFNFRADEWVWRNNNFKNEIHGDVHGDMTISQTDSSGRDYEERTLFGDERIFDCMKKVNSFGFGAYQDWSEFLVSLLKYSEKVGMSDIQEIADWKGTLEEIGGGFSGACAEAFGRCCNAKFNARMLMDSQLMCDGEKLKISPLTIWNQNTGTLPFFRDGKLIYMKQDKEGGAKFNERYFKLKRFSKVVEYSPDDIPHAIKGTLKYFARSRKMIPAIMNEFNRK